jgi:DNA-binding PadR family transcriptional regulator
MTVYYQITESGLANLGVDLRLDKFPTKGGITPNDVLSILDSKFHPTGTFSFPTKEVIARRVKDKPSRVESILERLEKLGYVEKVGSNKNYEDPIIHMDIGILPVVY